MIYKIFFTLICLLTAIQSASANKIENISAFATIPILHEGRIKPIDSFARSILKKLSNKESPARINPSTWLMNTIIDPINAANQPIIKITNPDLLSTLNLKYKPFYSYTEIHSKFIQQNEFIAELMQKSKLKLTQNQIDLIELQNKLILLDQLMNSISMLLPLNIDIPKDAPDYLTPYIGRTISFFDANPLKDKLKNDLNIIVKNKGENLSKYTASEQAITYLLFSMDHLQQKNNNNDLFKIIFLENSKIWLSPWEIMSKYDTNKADDLLNQWKKLAAEENSENLNKILISISKKTQNINEYSYEKIKLEYSYNLIHPHELSFIFYILSLIFICASSLFKISLFSNIAPYCLSVGAIIQIFGICARIFILSRPPISTLYETILFVGAAIVMYSLLLWKNNNKVIFLIIGAISGIILHMLGFSYKNDGDTFIMLDAVLNTNFWLATHVLFITTGYAFCLTSSAIAHYLLIHKNSSPDLQKSLTTSLLLSLFFTSVGTILGGIWADQSWGRFWGWDPKENGALLITLWLVWVIHGRISGQLNYQIYLASTAYLSVIVALSWFGVNLLGIGMHSYGFTNSLILWLSLLITGETALISALCWRKHNAS